MRRRKAALIGLTALALVAASALVVAVAQGNPTDPHEPKITHEFTCVKGAEHNEHVTNCTGHGEQKTTHRKHNEEFWTDHTYTTPLGEITCEEVTFDVTLIESGTSKTAPTTPTYGKCKSGNNEVHVVHDKCHYEFNVEETVTTTNAPEGYEETEGKGSAEIVCEEAGEAITVQVTNIFGGTKCKIEVRPQKTITPIYFRNSEADPTDMTVEAHTATVNAHFIEGGFFGCGTAATEAHTQYVGNTTVIGQKGENDSEQVDIRFDDGKTHVTPEEWELT